MELKSESTFLIWRILLAGTASNRLLRVVDETRSYAGPPHGMHGIFRKVCVSRGVWYGSSCGMGRRRLCEDIDEQLLKLVWRHPRISMEGMKPPKVQASILDVAHSIAEVPKTFVRLLS